MGRPAVGRPAACRQPPGGARATGRLDVSTSQPELRPLRPGCLAFGGEVAEHARMVRTYRTATLTPPERYRWFTVVLL